MYQSTKIIRQRFINFFHEKKHKIIKSSSLIPINDQSILFTNAGMNQFKNIFLDTNQNYKYSKVVTNQYCLRTGGKHNDLETVGYSIRHHTFFEMLGNFSFGDYFKKQAILYAWELLTSKKWFALPKERFLITVYKTDEETYEIWKNVIGIPENRIISIGDKCHNSPYISDNFWYMGESGPCGPCTEIFYNQDSINPSTMTLSDDQIKKYFEVWNIVFMQFDKKKDGSFCMLPKPSIDTGMGLERIASIIQNVSSNYEIDIFKELIQKIEKINRIKHNLKNNISLRIIADHIRACYFMISENIIPSNEGRGYVLRRIIRRASRHGYLLGIKHAFLYQLINSVICAMNITDNYLIQKTEYIKSILMQEEVKFNYTLENGLKLLNTEIKKVHNGIIDGEVIFYLYDTFGFPVDLTKEVCIEHNIKIDEIGFKHAMDQQKKRSRDTKVFNSNYKHFNSIDQKTIFMGYTLNQTKSTIINIIINNQFKDTMMLGEKGIILLDKTPFYPESGGQIGDIGHIYNDTGTFTVENTKKNNDTIFHIGTITSGYLTKTHDVTANIDSKIRTYIEKNHSATHLLNSALRKILGNHIYQNGSLVKSDLIRFDFFHNQPMTLLIVQNIEQLVNKYIFQNNSIKTKQISLEDAKNKNITRLLNKTYHDNVRVICIDKHSQELCGGTHTKKTGNIGLFKIITQRSIASNIYRIEAVTGEIALKLIHEQENNIQKICSLLKTNKYILNDSIKKIISHNNHLKKELNELQDKEVLHNVNLLIKQTKQIKHVTLLINTLKDKNIKIIHLIINELINKFQHSIIILANILHNKVTIIVRITKHVSKLIKANELIKIILNDINGKGGGNESMAEGGSTYLQKLPKAFKNIELWINSIL
ncbi:alanine--tRNA ligase [Buchnera aphidicola]|uniref:alanine--tRNA ligase n=1 Tax=Buchnera aphidicola TaxID=9 RepID=UPI0031B8500D